MEKRKYKVIMETFEKKANDKQDVEMFYLEKGEHYPTCLAEFETYEQAKAYADSLKLDYTYECYGNYYRIDVVYIDECIDDVYNIEYMRFGEKKEYGGE